MRFWFRLGFLFFLFYFDDFFVWLTTVRQRTHDSFPKDTGNKKIKIKIKIYSWASFHTILNNVLCFHFFIFCFFFVFSHRSCVWPLDVNCSLCFHNLFFEFRFVFSYFNCIICVTNTDLNSHQFEFNDFQSEFRIFH